MAELGFMNFTWQFLDFIFSKKFYPNIFLLPFKAHRSLYTSNKKAHALRIGSKMKGVNATKKLQNYEQI